MLPVELERVLSSVVDTILVGEEVGEHSHLGDDRPVLKDFLFDAYIFLRQAIVNDFVHDVVGSALIGLQVFLFAFAFRAVVSQTLLQNEALPLAPVQHSVHVPTVAVVVRVVARDKLLGRQTHLLLGLLTDTVRNHG